MARSASELPRPGAGGVQPDTRGLDFYAADPALDALLAHYLPAEQYEHVRPHLARLGALVGDRLDDLARTAERNPPVLHVRDREGRDVDHIEKHPAYREIERIAFEEFEMGAMDHRPALGFETRLDSIVKYAFTYLFAQSEFSFLCPYSMTDSLTRSLRMFGDETLVGRYLDRLVATDLDSLAQGAMFMTEREAGSDVGATTTRAVRDGDAWRLHGDKWFCSNTDAELAMVLARPEGAGPGTRGLGLFLMPRTLPDGSRNRYRIVRLKDKLGTRSMPSGEITLEGARAWLVGDIGQGFRQMAEMINQSRLSNAVRAAGLMRRACHEALTVAREREQFGEALIEKPLMRRQLLKLLLPTEAALSVVMYTAEMLRRTDTGDEAAKAARRILTPLVKFRVCRDARRVTGDAMEVRGGCGYIEDWIEPRLLRESHLGSIWEGTSNIVALDVVRAARKSDAHRHLGAALEAELSDCAADMPESFRARLVDALQRALDLTDVAVAGERAGETLARQAATGLYYACAATLLACEGVRFSRTRGDARRLLFASAVLEHRLSPRDPLGADESAHQASLEAALLGSNSVPLDEAHRLLRPTTERSR